MPIVMRLDRVMADRKMSSIELAEKVGISPVNISRIKGIRFSTLEAMCKALRCKPGDIIDWMDEDEYIAAFGKLPD